MQISVSLAISDGSGKSELSLLTLEIDAQPSIATLGLGLADSKALLARLQDQIVTRRIQSLSTAERRCEVCGSNRSIKDYHDIQYRSLFGSVAVKVPRWRRCECSCSSSAAPSQRGRRRVELLRKRIRECAGIVPAGSAQEGLDVKKAHVRVLAVIPSAFCFGLQNVTLAFFSNDFEGRHKEVCLRPHICKATYIIWLKLDDEVNVTREPRFAVNSR